MNRGHDVRIVPAAKNDTTRIPAMNREKKITWSP
jgi:hypothetical protein